MRCFALRSNDLFGVLFAEQTEPGYMHEQDVRRQVELLGREILKRLGRVASLSVWVLLLTPAKSVIAMRKRRQELIPEPGCKLRTDRG